MWNWLCLAVAAGLCVPSNDRGFVRMTIQDLIQWLGGHPWLLLAAFVALPLVAWLLRPHRPYPGKVTTYECGEEPIGIGWIRFHVRYYLYALVYIIFAQWLFGFKLGWFPVQGWSESFWRNLTYYAPLPVMLAIFVGLAPQLRLFRSFFLEEIHQDYVRTARAKGLPEKKVMMKHVLRNALIPILTNVGIYLPGLFVGSFLLEVFFSIPGLGREIVTAVNRSDFPVIKAVTVYLAMLTMFINLLVDVLYKFVDPRVSFK
jgi:ABC-type microcin C transport system permease subunit YejB